MATVTKKKNVTLPSPHDATGGTTPFFKTQKILTTKVVPKTNVNDTTGGRKPIWIGPKTKR